MLSMAEKQALILAEETRQRELSENINKLVTKKMDFKPRETIKRNKSFKGTMRPMLMGFDHDEWHHQVIGKRSTSPKDTKKREGAIRKTVHHF